MPVSRYGIYTFHTKERNVYYISYMARKGIANPIAIGESYTYFLYNHFKLIKNQKRVEEGTKLSSTSDSFDFCESHVSKFGRNSSSKKEKAKFNFIMR